MSFKRLLQFVAVAVLLLALPTTGQANDKPTITVGDDGTLNARVVIPASPQAVRAELSDAVSLGQLSKDVYETSVIQRGKCQEVTRKIRGMWSPLTYRVLRCPTQNGWREDLIERGDIERYRLEVNVIASDEGTVVEYNVLTEPNLPVPKSIIRGEAKKSVASMLRNLVRKVTSSETE